MWFKLKNLRIRLTFLFAVFFALTLQGRARGELFTLLLCAALHECAHAFLLLRFGCKNLTLTLLPGGLRLSDDAFASLSYRQMASAALAGPLCNFALAAAGAVLFLFLPREGLRRFITVNLLLGGGNLLPLSFLDGGAAFYALLSFYKKSAPPHIGGGDLLCTVALCFLCGGMLLLKKRADLLAAFTGYCLAYQLLRRGAAGGAARGKPPARRQR